MSTTPPIVVPEGFTLHKENSAYLLLPSSNEAFLNTVQEFNRDLSVACIRAWSERTNREKETKWKERKAKAEAKALSRNAKKRKIMDVAGSSAAPPAEDVIPIDKVIPESVTKPADDYRPYRISILEPLSATGLRSIRYANEIPLVKYVIANDLSSDAIAAMRRNVEINNLGPKRSGEQASSSVTEPGDVAASLPNPKPEELPKVRVNQGDASALMYNLRSDKDRVDVVDLDPYGTAAPFIDGAVQCVSDGGLLCITCTDLAVLAGTNYPEKCFANYGGMPVKAEYTHEVALRLVLSSVATAAARYGRSITPLLSLSIDFYVRVFVRVKSAPIEVKNLACNTATYYVCTSCQAWHEQPMGKVIEKTSEKSPNVNRTYRTAMGPTIGTECEECSSRFHLAGPMWSGPLHDREFVKETLEIVKANPASFGTSSRMQGMLTIASEELTTPFYFTPSKVSSLFHCNCPSLHDISSALLNAGHEVSRSHAAAGSIKTTASRKDVHDVFRGWVKLHPVKMDSLSESSPSYKLLTKEPSAEANFNRHPNYLSSSIKLVRYQQNPTPNWGPGTRAGGSKRKHTKEENNHDT